MDGPSSAPTPNDPAVDGEALLPQARAATRKRACLRSCLCYSALILASALLGSASTTAYFVARDLLDSPANASSVEPTTCPGVCVARALHGTFAHNVSATKHVGPVEVIVKFYVSHSFDWDTRTAALRVDPIDFEPHWLPSVLHPIRCDAVPFTLGDACNITLGSECTRQAYKIDDIAALELTWDVGRDEIAASETVSTGFFTQTFVWSEERLT